MEPSKNAADYLQESRLFEQAGNIAGAIGQARRAFTAAQESGDHEASAQALLACAQAFFRLGNYGECERLSRQALELAGVESVARVDGLRMLGICALETNQMIPGEQHLRQAIALSRQIGSDRLLVRCLHNLSAGVYAPRGQFDLSLQADQELLRICRERGYTDISWGPLLTMSWVYWLCGQRENCQQRLGQLEGEALPGSLAYGYAQLIHAHLFLDNGQWQEANPFVESVLSTGEMSGFPELRVLGRVARSRCLRLGGDLPAALDWAEDARQIAADIHYQHLEGMALIELGRAAYASRHLARAEQCLSSAVELLDPLALNFDAARAALLFAAVLHEQGSSQAPVAWRDAADRMLEGGFLFLIDTETELAGRLISAYEAPGGALMQRFRLSAPARLRIVTFGGLRVAVGGRAIDSRALRRRRADELLVLLLLATGHCLPGEQIMDALFPEHPSGSIRASFHQASSALRRALEPDLPEQFPSRYLDIDEGQVALRLPPGSQVDFDQFVELCRAQRWKEALALAEGEFLPELLYTEWAALPRQRLNAALQQALIARARECLAANLYSEAIAHCRRLLAVEPWHEGAVLVGMEAYLRQDDRAGARRLYRQLEKSLKTDLDSLPSDEVQAFYHQLDRRYKE